MELDMNNNDNGDNLQLMFHFVGQLIFDDGNEDANDPAVWEHVTVNVQDYRYMSNAAFKLHFRMSRDVFEELINAVGQQLDNGDVHHVDPNYCMAHILLMVVWILATPDTFRSVALRFGVTPGVLHYHYLRVISTLSEMAPTYVTWPHRDEREAIKRAVEARTGFPGVVGAVDGTHIKLNAPHEEPGRYFNRHHDHSIVLQAVSDETLLFRDIYAGEPGSTHDSRIFRRSPLCSELLENPERYFEDMEHILGDGAYICTDRLLTPFRDHGNLTPEQRNYNHRHASARVVVERSFGLLKGKWRRLFWLTSHNIEFAVLTVVACVVLHNFLILEGQHREDQDPDAQEAHPAPRENDIAFVDGDIDDDFDHPELLVQRDHPLLAEARILGVEKRRDIMGRLLAPAV